MKKQAKSQEKAPAIDNKELILALEELEKEKGMDKEYLLEAIETALVTAYKRNFDSLENVKVEMGAGKTHIANLNTDILDLNLGAGKNLLEKLEVNTQTKIESGAGLTEIMAGTLNNVDLDLGVGKVFINASILGNSKIECGVGSVELNLLGNQESYQLNVEKGIGSIDVANKIYNNDDTIGNGKNHLKIEGGIGNIKVGFTNK